MLEQEQQARQRAREKDALPCKKRTKVFNKEQL